LRGFNPNRVYIAYRRYSDFLWLHNKLQSVEKNKGCPFPPLPPKTAIWKNSEETVKKRQEVYFYKNMYEKGIANILADIGKPYFIKI